LTQQTFQQKAKFYAENLRENLEKLYFNVSELSKKQYNYEFEVRQLKSKVKILIYFGNKGIKTIIQGNQNDELYKELDSLIFGKLPFETPNLVEPSEYIGSDESGKGDFFGPLIVCAFAYDISLKDELTNLNVKDSKELNDNDLLKIYKKLSEKFQDRFETVEIHPKKYNELYEKIQNLNKILVWAHSKAINNLLKKFDYQNIIIDKFAAEKSFEDKISVKKRLIFEEKAERFAGVAAASIIARARLLNWFDKKSKAIGIKIPLGASNSATKVAEEIQTKNGKEFLNDLIKLHFKNFKEMNK
jgi:ribonuclease HIII